MTDRDCPLRRGILQDSRPRPCTGGLLSPWSVVLFSPHLRLRVVVGFRQCTSDRHTLVSPPRAQSSLPPPPCGGAPIAVNFHQLLVSTKKATQERSRLSADDCVCGGGGGCGSDPCVAHMSLSF